MEIKDLSPKQHKELVSISPLLCQYGYIESADMCSDKPDICPEIMGTDTVLKNKLLGRKL